MSTLAPEYVQLQPDLLASMRAEMEVCSSAQKEATARFHESIDREVTDDSEGWGRTLLQIEGFDFRITFRGKNELPDLSGRGDIEICSLTPVYRQPDTELLTADALKGWSAKYGNALLPETNSEPSLLIERVMQTATDEGREVVVSVDATPLGICQLLRAVKEEYAPDFFSDDVLELLSYAKEDEIVNNAAAQQLLLDMVASGYNPAGGEGPHKDALAVLLCTRIGRPEDRETAQAVLDERKKLFELHHRYSYMVDRGLTTAEELESGADYDKEAMAEHSQGLVWVHNNRSRIGRGQKIMPGGVFNTESSRSSVHGTLNHLVTNELAQHGRAIDSRGHTVVVAPLPSMILANEKPTSLYGVDTYWEDEAGVTVPPEAILISRGNERIEASDSRDIVVPTKLAREQAVAYVENLLEQKKWLIEGAKQTYRRSLENANLDENSKALRLYSYDETRKNAILRRIETADEDSDYAGIVYDEVAVLAIQASGGDVVQSDGMSEHVETPGFDKAVIGIAKRSGILTGLHADHPSSSHTGTEAAMTALRSKVFDFEVLEGDRVAKTQAHPEKLDSAQLWGVVDRSPQKSLEWIMTGWLSFEQNAPNSSAYRRARREDEEDAD